jgi:hypothetical protein
LGGCRLGVNWRSTGGGAGPDSCGPICPSPRGTRPWVVPSAGSTRISRRYRSSIRRCRSGYPGPLGLGLSLATKLSDLAQESSQVGPVDLRQLYRLRGFSIPALHPEAQLFLQLLLWVQLCKLGRFFSEDLSKRIQARSDSLWPDVPAAELGCCALGNSPRKVAAQRRYQGPDR